MLNKANSYSEKPQAIGARLALLAALTGCAGQNQIQASQPPISSSKIASDHKEPTKFDLSQVVEIDEQDDEKGIFYGDLQKSDEAMLEAGCPPEFAWAYSRETATAYIVDSSRKRIGPVYNDPDNETVRVYGQNGKQFHVNHCGISLYESRFDEVPDDFFHSKGVARVKDDGVAFHITKEGKPLYDERYDEVSYFSEELAGVTKDGKQFHITTDGDPAYTERYDEVGRFYEEAAVATEGKKEFHIKANGNPLYSYRYDSVSNFRIGYAIATLNNKSFIIDRSGRPIDNKRYDEVDYTGSSYAKSPFKATVNGHTFEIRLPSSKKADPYFSIKEDSHLGYEHHVKEDGTELYASRFGDVRSVYFINGASEVYHDGAFHIDQKGHPLYSERFEDVESYDANGIARVKLEGKWMHIDKKGKLLYKDGFDLVTDFVGEWARATEDGKYFYIKKDGTRAYESKLDYNDRYKAGEGMTTWGKIDKAGLYQMPDVPPKEVK